ncbi:galactose-1-phosphate uridylyltransferase [Chloroflexota bacterium]
MSELREDCTTGDWVLIAPERAKRPQNRPKEKLTTDLPDWDESCPFCPGNESKTPQEVFRLPTSEPASAWMVRVVPNRFAAVIPGRKSNRIRERYFFHRMDGIGVHEVIIETPSHNATMALMPYEHVEEVLGAYQQRYNAWKNNPQFKFITIFKNHGQAAGTSLIHPHSQLITTPIAAPFYRRKFDMAFRHYNYSGRCLYCSLLIEELDKGERIVAETKQFIVFHPYASRVPWETWIIPKEHRASFGLSPPTYLTELAMVLKDSLLCLYRGLDNPDFNLMVDTTSTDEEEAPYYHWHIRIVPRLTTIAGFEMGSGIHISTALPEETAMLMKESANSSAENECLSFKGKA